MRGSAAFSKTSIIALQPKRIASKLDRYVLVAAERRACRSPRRGARASRAGNLIFPRRSTPVEAVTMAARAVITVPPVSASTSRPPHLIRVTGLEN